MARKNVLNQKQKTNKIQTKYVKKLARFPAYSVSGATLNISTFKQRREPLNLGMNNRLYRFATVVEIQDTLHSSWLHLT